MFSINANTAACLFIRSAMTRRWSSSEWRANSTRIGTSCVACATAGAPRRPSGWTAISTRSGNRRQSIWPRSFFRPYSELAMPNCAAMPGGEVVTLFETLRNVLPRSLFTHLGEPPRAIEVPHRVAELIRAREEDSERLIGWVQLVMAATFATLYVIAPRPLDAGMSMLAPVPLALSGYAAFTAARLWFAHRGFLPGWLLVLSMLVDTALLLGLIWAFHFQYEQPAAFSLKVPTFVYIFAFIALRALRFDHAVCGTVCRGRLGAARNPCDSIIRRSWDNPQFRRIHYQQQHFDRRRVRQDLYHPDGDGPARHRCPASPIDAGNCGA